MNWAAHPRKRRSKVTNLEEILKPIICLHGDGQRPHCDSCFQIYRERVRREFERLSEEQRVTQEAWLGAGREIAVLRAENARLIAERDAAREYQSDHEGLLTFTQGQVATAYRDIDELHMKLTAAEQRIAEAEGREKKLLEALKKFGIHYPDCRMIWPTKPHGGECDCGYSAALAATKESAGGEKG